MINDFKDTKKEEMEEEIEDDEKMTWKEFCEYFAWSFKQIKEFSLSFWIVVVITAMYYSCIYSFLNFSQSLLNSHYGFSYVSAGYVTSIISFCALILSPLTGKHFILFYFIFILFLFIILFPLFHIFLFFRYCVGQSWV